MRNILREKLRNNVQARHRSSFNNFAEQPLIVCVKQYFDQVTDLCLLLVGRNPPLSLLIDKYKIIGCAGVVPIGIKSYYNSCYMPIVVPHCIQIVTTQRK